jgi:hypothetical protein
MKQMKSLRNVKAAATAAAIMILVESSVAFAADAQMQYLVLSMLSYALAGYEPHVHAN